MTTVKLENIEKTYPNGFKAIHGVDVEIGDGELIVLGGSSGTSPWCFRITRSTRA